MTHSSSSSASDDLINAINFTPKTRDLLLSHHFNVAAGSCLRNAGPTCEIVKDEEEEEEEVTEDDEESIKDKYPPSQTIVWWLRRVIDQQQTDRGEEEEVAQTFCVNWLASYSESSSASHFLRGGLLFLQRVPCIIM